MTEQHEPRAQFEEYLEWQLRTGLRRRERFGDEGAAPTTRTSRLRSWGVRAALVLISIVVGAGGTVAAERYQNSRRAQLLREQEQVRLRIDEERLRLTEANLARLEEAFRAGLASERELLATEQRVEAARHATRVRRLYVEEIELGGREPREEITAPLVGGRDFVQERLQLELDRCQGEQRATEHELDRIRALAQAGVITSQSMTEAEQRVTESKFRGRELRELLDLRNKFIGGETTEATATRSALRLQTQRTGERLNNRLVVAREQLARVRALHAAAAVSSKELRTAQSQVSELELQLQLNELEQRIIEEPSEATANKR